MDFLKCQRSGVGFSAMASDELENVGEYTKYLWPRGDTVDQLAQ